jgi:hypothetical protein
MLIVIAVGALVWAAAEDKVTKADSARAEASKAEDAAKTAGASVSADMPDPAKLMEMMTKVGTPGPEHEKLKMLEGKFDADVTIQMMPNMPEEKSKGTATNEMIFDGRYLTGQYEGEFGGKPFKGHGLWAYDNAKKKYISGWIDSMSTGVMMAEGTADSSGKVITVTCDMTCPITNKPMKTREVLTIQDADHYTYESYASLDGGPEHKSMTIKYTRAK